MMVQQKQAQACLGIALQMDEQACRYNPARSQSGLMLRSLMHNWPPRQLPPSFQQHPPTASPQLSHLAHGALPQGARERLEHGAVPDEAVAGRLGIAVSLHIGDGGEGAGLVDADGGDVGGGVHGVQALADLGWGMEGGGVEGWGGGSVQMGQLVVESRSCVGKALGAL